MPPSPSRAKSMVALARPPVRFLSQSVPLVDLYLGQQDQAEKLIEGSDVSVIFYYAPWCAHSIAAREHIQQVALHLANQVQFVAVNCWWHQGKCRKQQNFFQYPVLHVYYRSFIRRVSAPLTYLPSRSALHTFLSHHQPGVVGFFDFNSSPQPPGYLTFLTSALHILRKDPQGVVRFGVVTNRMVAAGMWVTEDQSVYLHRRFNTSLVFPHSERNFTAENICNWVFENKESIITWIQPIGEKSQCLEAELRKGPALLMFLPQSPFSASQILSEVADVALSYHSCLAHSVSSSVWSPSGSVMSEPKCCKSVHIAANPNTKVCEVCVRSAWELEAALDSFLLSTLSTAWSVCRNSQRSYSTLHHYTACCRTLTHRLHPLQDEGGVTGLHCRTNMTLRFYALDSRVAWKLALRLGASGNHSTHSNTHTFTTIVNLKDDTHYVLQDTGRDALARLFQGNSAFTLARVNVGVNDLPWEFMVDHLPTFLFFPRHRKQMSVKFPENTVSRFPI
ncbi:hypothetical protein HF521_012515 [Silurus meridionalis]|uniref:Thioredoxin domain-containing protein n=1 Tax=Silurus meridionalis TaxID=175797 RepID=A0A8T0ADH4_SILME|nr:hypothetical protein HF521_012515 [Silurus meridionalis]